MHRIDMTVFISYTNQDKAIAEKIVSVLHENDIRTWLDLTEIRPGESWVVAITKAIQSCDVYLFLISRRAAESPTQRSELSIAIAEREGQKDKVLIPVLIEKGAKLPFFLHDLQYIDMSDEESFQRNAPKLVTAVKSHEYQPSEKEVRISRKLHLKGTALGISLGTAELRVERYRRSAFLTFTLALLGALASIAGAIFALWSIGRNSNSILFLSLGIVVGAFVTALIAQLSLVLRAKHIDEKEKDQTR